MYAWRRMTAEQRRATLRERRLHRQPWHSPPHRVGDTCYYHITAACYEHRPVVGHSSDRMSEFEKSLLETVRPLCEQVVVWALLPNHYHLLVRTLDIKRLLKQLGRLHGRTSFEWNGQESRRGRKVWCNVVETAIKSEGHFWATLNYVLNNPVRHGYVQQWLDWPYSNAADYLASVGRATAERIWREFPVLDMGKDWDPPEM